MPSPKQKQEKSRLHPRNRNRERYDLKALTVAIPELVHHIKPNKYGADSVDFANPVAVKLLNQALLHHYYGIEHWNFPDKNLCPPIPGRADYVHHVADLLASSNFGKIPKGDQVSCLDVGVGASCIYPILGVVEYGWSFVGSDISPESIASAQSIVEANSVLRGKVECRLQENSRLMFQGVLKKEEKIDLTICNPPFHASQEEAQKGTRRKVQNLSGKKVKTPRLNFAGIFPELIYEGGERGFIHQMIRESAQFSKQCFWFTTLVSKQSNLKGVHKALAHMKATQVKTIPMGTGNKSTRIVAWSFLTKEEQKEWRTKRWTK